MFKASRTFRPKKRPDGSQLLNLGSSARVADGWTNVDFNWLVRIGRHRCLSWMLHRVGLISGARYARIQKIDRDMVVWNLAKGIPFHEESFDVVYHSHLLEHLDRPVAPVFLAECFRVLKPGGVLRIVVPDLEQLARNYVKLMDRSANAIRGEEHSIVVEEIFDQMVCQVPKVRKQLNIVNRLIEGVLVGNTSRNGDMHRWMYDRVSLTRVLNTAGFVDVQQHTHLTSAVSGWEKFYLDNEIDGSAYKHTSLFLEAQRPPAAQEGVDFGDRDQQRRAG